MHFEFTSFETNRISSIYSETTYFTTTHFQTTNFLSNGTKSFTTTETKILETTCNFIFDFGHF